MADRFGAIQSPPDPNDLVVPERPLARLAGATTWPPSYLVHNRPPMRDQGWTPQCVAYSSAYEKAQQDYLEFDRWFDFDEAAFFYSIGGNDNGAVMRYALDRMARYGYPEADATPSPGKHQIAGYFRIEQAKAAIKAGIVATAGLLVVGPWWDSWSSPYGSEATLPPPSGPVNGHAWWAAGYDEVGVIGQNSWGSAWGNNGRFRIDWYYVVNYMWEIWKTADERTLSTVAKARIPNTDVNIRTEGVLGDHGTLDGTRWGYTRANGIHRARDNKIVVEPYNKALVFGGFRHGARHGHGNYPESWARLKVGREWRCVARPFIRLVNA